MLHPSITKIVTEKNQQEEEDELKQDDVNLRGEVINIPSPEPDDSSPETGDSVSMCSNTNLSIPLKNTLIFQNEYVAHFNPPTMVDIFGLRVHISEPSMHHKMVGKELGKYLAPSTF